MTKSIPISGVEIPPELLKAVIEKRAILFAGAGVSRSSVKSSSVRGLPDWKELLLAVVRQAGSEDRLHHSDILEFQRAIEAGKYLFVAEALQEEMGGSFHATLRKIIDVESEQPNDRHKLIAELPFVAILTTNFDKLLETAFRDANKPITSFTPAEAPEMITALVNGTPFILKAHGDIDKHKTLVLAEGHYRELLYRQPAYLTALQTIFLIKTVLFIGTSLSDPDVRLVLETVKESFRDHAPLHYALIPESSAGRMERRFWRDLYRIELLTYPDHLYVDHFLKELKNQVHSLAPRLGWQQQILEAKWYPSKSTLKQLTREIKTKVPDVLNCNRLSQPQILNELNILFDTPAGSLYESRINLSIKVIANKRDNAWDLKAHWVLIKLRGFPNDLPEKMWDRNQEPQDHFKVYKAKTDLNRAIKQIVTLPIPTAINKLLRTEAEITAVKPVMIISVRRRCWFFSSRIPNWHPRLFISEVRIHPYSQSWLKQLSTLDTYQRPGDQKDWSWEELELEVEESSDSDNQSQFYVHFEKFENKYNLNPLNNQKRPLAKYHHAVTVLRNFYRSQPQSKNCRDWQPFLKSES